MVGLLAALGIAILTLLAILLWFVPHLLQQQSWHNAHEAAQLRELLDEVVLEQEAVAMRQVQLGTSISYLQEQIEHVIAVTHDHELGSSALATLDTEALHGLERRVTTLQQQIDVYMRTNYARSRRDSESWLHLLSLLTAIQEHIRTRAPVPPGGTPVNPPDHQRHLPKGV